MKIFTTIRLLLTFYKNFFFFNLLITLACMVLFGEYGMSIFAVLFWLKLTTLGLAWYFIRSYKSKEFFYYQNLGLSSTFLWTSTLSFDFGLYLFLLSAVHLGVHLFNRGPILNGVYVFNEIHLFNEPHLLNKVHNKVHLLSKVHLSIAACLFTGIHKPFP